VRCEGIIVLTMHASVTAVIVSFADPAGAAAALNSLLEQSMPPAEVLVVDNHPDGLTSCSLASVSLPACVKVLRPATNIGYTGAANLAAREARGEWLFYLNPDAVAADDCLEHLLGSIDDSDVAIVGAQVLLPDGRINAGENPINIAGFSWSGNYGAARERGPARDTAAVSGAALLVRREAFLTSGGLCPFFFLYVDDTDLAWRMRLRGLRVRYCPEAVVVHDYEFQKGSHKWFYLERNRMWALMSNMQLRTLVLLAPLLLAAEVAVTARAISEGWLAEKAKAWASLLSQLPQLNRWRRSVQAARNVSDSEVLGLFSAGIETNLVDTRLPSWVERCLACYRNGVLWALRRSKTIG
jgi:GT2 family glycosyltransferase